MLYRKSILSLVIVLGTFIQAFSQAIPKLQDIQISAFVNYVDAESGLYIYNYSIRNGGLSTGNITRVQIDISTSPEEVTYDTAGLKFANKYTKYRFEKDFPPLKGEVVPVGIPDLPQFWRGVITSEKNLVLRTDVRNDIEPGKSIHNIRLSSKGLPGLKKFKAEPFIDVRKFYPSEFEVNNLDSLIKIIEEDRNEASDSGYTIGPKAPPEKLTPIVYTDTLSTYLNRSCTELGWITNQGLCRSLEAKLDNVQRQLDQGNTRGAAGSLQAFLNEVEAQKDKKLSSEAYALLYFNGQYLLEQLNQ